jgi:adenine-specific DNA-methyltransferase
MEDYAETITAERVKRVMKKIYELEVINDKLGSTHNSSLITHNYKFDFYELGQPMFLEDGNLNENVDIEKIRQYVYYTETKSVMNYELEVMSEKGTHNSSLITHHSFLGKHNDTAYYFNYEQNEVTTLDHAFLATMKTKAEQYVIYADNCLLTKEYMTKHHIIFKKIPRDITKF